MHKKFLATLAAVMIMSSGVGYCDSISVEYVDLLENYMSGKSDSEKDNIGKVLEIMFADEETLEISKKQYLEKMDADQKATLEKLGITSDQIVSNFEALKSWSNDDRKKLIDLAKDGNKDGILSLNSSYKNTTGSSSSVGSSSGSSGASGSVSGGGASGPQGTTTSNPVTQDTVANPVSDRKPSINVGFRNTEIPVKVEKDYKTFKDVEKHWSKDFVDFFAKRGIVNGKDKDNFKPDDNITKAEITKIVSEVFISDSSSLESKNLSFKDIKSDDWYYKYVNNLSNIGVIDDSESFEGDKYPSREEIIDLMIKTLKSSGISISSDGSSFNREFKDISAIDSKYRESVVIAENLGIINGVGDNKLDPKSTVTRAQVMALTKNLYDYIMKNLN